MLARDKLAVFYEVPKDEIDPLIASLGDLVDPSRLGNVSDKARMTLCSKTDGIVIEREVVPGNYYESTDVLMKIAPLDHLWVWVNVYELDQHMVRVGPDDRNPVSLPGTAGARRRGLRRQRGRQGHPRGEDRASIPNPDSRLKAEMLVKAMLEIPPVAGQTVIPRLSMVAIDDKEYAFVRVPKGAAGGR